MCSQPLPRSSVKTAVLTQPTVSLPALRPDIGNEFERFLVVRLGDRSVAIRVPDTRGVVELQAITPVPRASAVLHGIIAARGTVMPLFSLTALLDQPVASPPLLAVVLEPEGLLFAVAVDEVLDFALLPCLSAGSAALLTPTEQAGRTSNVLHLPTLLQLLAERLVHP